MSQRRPPAGAVLPTTTVVDESGGDNGALSGDHHREESAPFIANSTPIEKGSLSIEEANNYSSDDDNLCAEDRYQIERHNRRVKHWRESPFACGLVNPTWAEERNHSRWKKQYGDDELSPDEAGCSWCSSVVCPYLNAGRVGHMVVLRSSTEWVEAVEEDEETGEEKTVRYSRPRLDMTVGPYWPMLVFVTYPLILGVSGWTLFSKVLVGKLSPMAVLLWTPLTVGLIVSLAFTACCDPGIMYKHYKPAPQDENSWRWTDRAHSYRPRNSYYDADTAVVVEEFDHTCPWTGTAIGKKNMRAFQCFVALVFICLVRHFSTIRVLYCNELAVQFDTVQFLTSFFVLLIRKR